MIARHFPPGAGGGVQRPLKLAKYLPQEGFDPIVIAAPPVGTEDPSLLDDLRDGQSVHQIKRSLADDSQFALRELKLGRVHRFMRKALTLADPGLIDVPAFVRTGLALAREYAPALVWATSLPFSSVVAGAALADKLGVPFIADLRDPWALYPWAPQISPLHQRAAESLERRTLLRAHRIVIVTPGMRDYLHPAVASRAEVIPNGFDPDDLRAEPEPKPADVFRVSYTGSFYGRRRPHAWLEAMARFAPKVAARGLRLEVVFAGNAREFSAALAQSPVAIEQRGYVSHDEAVALVKSSDVSMVLNGPEAIKRYWASGKLYESIAAAEQVLGWTPVDGIAAQVIDETGAGGSAQTPEAFDRLLDLALDRKLAKVPLSARAVRLVPYDRRTIAHTYGQIFRELCDRSA